FSPYQQRIIEGIAQLGSFALDNARLFEELERAHRFRSDFVATMSHELRTPMSVILGYQEMLLEGAFGRLTQEQSDTLGRAHRSAAELLDLVNAALDLSRMETRHIPLTWHDVTVEQLLDDVAAETALPPEKRELRLLWHAPPAPLTIRTDAVKARMVLKNLVGNAIKFTDRGRITIAAHARGGGVELTVSDTGIGVAAAQQQAIFEPFRQLDSSPTRRGGAGLGLYIVKRLVDALGGTIAIESALGQGATFRVWLPLAPTS
ncbi:MAG: HAMP domain-containing sensor histidine kinase, partial [bacterium]